MSKREKFLEAARTQVNKGIYVCGAKGQDVSAMSDKEREKWIRRREKDDETNVKRVLALYNKRVKAGVGYAIGLVRRRNHDAVALGDWFCRCWRRQQEIENRVP